MTQEEKNLKVTVSYGEIKVEFTGDPQSIIYSINDFVAKQIPAIDLAHKISVNYSVNDLINMFGEYIKLTPEGPRVWKSEQKLSDKDIVGLQLVAAKISNEIGKTQTSSITLVDIRSATDLNPKSISSRISEMSKSGYVDKETGEQGVCYRITTEGIHWLNQALTKKSGRA